MAKKRRSLKRTAKPKINPKVAVSLPLKPGRGRQGGIAKGMYLWYVGDSSTGK